MHIKDEGRFRKNIPSEIPSIPKSQKLIKRKICSVF